APPQWSRSIEFDNNSTSQSLLASSSRVQSWTATQIQFDVPPGVQDGTLKVIVDGVQSNLVDLKIYVYSTTATTTTDSSHPLAVAVGPDSTAWVIDEFNKRVKSFTNAVPSSSSAPIVPEAAGP